MFRCERGAVSGFGFAHEAHARGTPDNDDNDAIVVRAD